LSAAKSEKKQKKRGVPEKNHNLKLGRNGREGGFQGVGEGQEGTGVGGGKSRRGQGNP